MYEIDKHLLVDLKEDSQTLGNKNKTVFIYPFGFCINFVDYDTAQDFRLVIMDYSSNYSSYSYEAMKLFINDPAMLTYFSIDQQSHQGKHLYSRSEITSTKPC